MTSVTNKAMSPPIVYMNTYPLENCPKDEQSKTFSSMKNNSFVSRSLFEENSFQLYIKDNENLKACITAKPIDEVQDFLKSNSYFNRPGLQITGKSHVLVQKQFDVRSKRVSIDFVDVYTPLLSKIQAVSKLSSEPTSSSSSLNTGPLSSSSPSTSDASTSVTSTTPHTITLKKDGIECASYTERYNLNELFEEIREGIAERIIKTWSPFTKTFEQTQYPHSRAKEKNTTFYVLMVTPPEIELIFKKMRGSCAFPECDKKRIQDKLRRCSRCKVTWYCSPEHQKAHWPIHKKECNPLDSSQDTKKSGKKTEAKEAKS